MEDQQQDNQAPVQGGQDTGQAPQEPTTPPPAGDNGGVPGGDAPASDDMPKEGDENEEKKDGTW